MSGRVFVFFLLEGVNLVHTKVHIVLFFLVHIYT